MKNQIKKKVTKIATVAAVTAMVMGTCVGCGNSESVADTDTDEVAVTEDSDAELVTYEFETFDNLKIVLDETNITVQESSEDPENSELIPAEAANNIIAPGRDYLYLEDDNNYYVADFARNLVTVADKSKVQAVAVEAETDEEETVENPGAFDTDSWSISYDTEKWYGYVNDEGNTVINYTGECAGTSLIEISEADVATVDEAVVMLEDARGKKLTSPEKVEKSGGDCYVTYDAPADSEEEGVNIFDFYLIYEKDGKVIIINESITQDPDESKAEALSYEFDDVINTFALK